MAKGDKKKKREVVELTPAEQFVQLKTLKQATRCLLVEEDVYRIYVRLVEDFAKLGQVGKETPFEGWEECEALSKECEVLAAEWKKKLPAERKVESRTVTTTVREQEEKETGKKGKGKWVVLSVVVLVIAFVVCYNVPASRYQIAGVAAKLGFDEIAMDSYEKLGDYGDVKERSLSLEKRWIRDAKLGSVVKFGKKQWIVLDRQNGKALLSLYMADNKHPFHDEKKEVTWENCSLRHYLNNEFMTESFNKEEQEIISATKVINEKNSEYGTDGGNDTVDRLYLLSENEYKQYKKRLKDKAKTMRLRTPGRDTTATVYVSVLKRVVTYGFPVDENGACIRPNMWVQYE